MGGEDATSRGSVVEEDLLIHPHRLRPFARKEDDIELHDIGIRGPQRRRARRGRRHGVRKALLVGRMIVVGAAKDVNPSGCLRTRHVLVGVNAHSAQKALELIRPAG